MLILYDFKCGEGHTTEKLTLRDEPFVLCDVCGNTATRVISPVRCKLDGLDPGFPGAYDKWTRDHEKRGGASEKVLDELNSK